MYSILNLDLDTTIAWRGMANAGLAYAEPGWAVAKVEARENVAYATTLEWQAKRFGNGERFDVCPTFLCNLGDIRGGNAGAIRGGLQAGGAPA